MQRCRKIKSTIMLLIDDLLVAHACPLIAAQDINILDKGHDSKHPLVLTRGEVRESWYENRLVDRQCMCNYLV